MPKPNGDNKNTIERKKKVKNKVEVKVEDKSGLVSFVNRPVPTNDEVEKFDEKIETEAKDEQIDESLSEIYRNEDGTKVNVREIKRDKKNWKMYLISIFFLIAFFGASFYGIYYFLFLRPATNPTAVEFSIEGPEELEAGEEFSYHVLYKNSNRVALKDAVIKFKFPKGFILLDSSKQIDKNGEWKIDQISPNYNGRISVKGKIIAPAGTNSIALANMVYTPANFSSEFKKEASLLTSIKNIGLNFNIDYVSPILVGDNNDIKIEFTPESINQIHNFRVTIDPLENLEIFRTGEEEDIRKNVFSVDEILDEKNYLDINLKFNEKLKDIEKLIFHFEHKAEDGEYYEFYKEETPIEVINSNLSLNLIVNGSRTDQGIDFGEKLNYTLVYANKGETELRNVILMANIESDFVDWTSLDDPSGGEVKGSAISWSREEIRALSVLDEGEEGTIDFSINVSEKGKIESGKKYEIKSFAQFNIGTSSQELPVNSENSTSNVIVNKINSDVGFVEKLLYFDENNLTVGSGPIPPKVGEESSFKVYWEVENSLHELSGLKVSSVLPEGVSWNEKSSFSVGNISYNESERKVEWDVGRLPIDVQSVSANFGIKTTPSEDNANKIMVLIKDTEVNAVDSETKENVLLKGKAKTTRLEDDEIANIDGIITK